MVFLILLLMGGTAVGMTLGMAGGIRPAMRHRRPSLLALGGGIGVAGTWMGAVVIGLVAYVASGSVAGEVMLTVMCLAGLLLLVAIIAVSTFACSAVGRRSESSLDPAGTLSSYERPKDS